MHISDPDFGLSFEFFPPKSLTASFRMWNTLEQLSPLDPSFVSVTYGAGGTSQDQSKSAVGVIAKEYGLDVAGHLTCVGATKSETLQVAQTYADAGAKRIVALRGDAPEGDTFAPHPAGFNGSVDLIAGLAQMDAFDISVGCYPNGHPDSISNNADLALLHSKFAAGASTGITQFFFEAEEFLAFRDRCARAGITQKIIPGILPIENWDKTKLFAARCGLAIPAWLDKAFANTHDKAEHDLLSTALCTEMCDTLLSEGVEDLHFYTLNDGRLTKQVCHALGRTSVKPQLTAAA